MKTTIFVLTSLLVGAPHIGHAADARKPYANVDKKVDAGNDTGDSSVDKLNEMELNKNYKGPTYVVGTPPVPQTTPLPLK
jgi:hypothetical protein